MANLPYPNHTGVKSGISEVIDNLQIQLATCFDLYSQVKQAHWNVKGPGFIGIHKMFDDLAEVLEGHTDTIAERIGSLGGYPMGYVSAAAASSRLDNPVDDLVQDLDWIAFILDQYHTFSTHLYSGIKIVGEYDPASEDLLIEIVRDIDKGIYFLAGHLDDETSADAYETGSDELDDEELEFDSDGDSSDDENTESEIF
jgi:starvation-inducible DNA-binding protein